jgi:hypothetical protein
VGALKEEQTNVYMEQVKKLYSVDDGVLNGMDWLIILAGSIGTILSVVAFFYWCIKLVVFIILANSGKAKMKDLRFWKRMGIALLIIVLIMSGSLVLIFARIFDFLAVWGWK